MTTPSTASEKSNTNSIMQMILKGYLRIIPVCLIFSCAYYPGSDEDVTGRYNSLSEKSKNYFFEFYKDKSYVQVLMNKGDTIYKASGNWKLLNNKGTLDLSNWFTIDNQGNVFETSRSGTLLESNNNLYFSSDDYTKNFEK